MGERDRKRKVLMVAPTSFFSDYGGHIRIYEEALALQNLGNEVIIATYYKGRDLPELDIRRCWPVPWRANYEVGSSRHKIIFDLLLALSVLWLIVRERPDIIHGHMHEGALIGGVFARLLGIPLVFDFQGSLTGEMVAHNFMQPNGRFFRLVHRLERLICRLPQATLTSSSQAQALLQREFHVPAVRIQPLPDCVDLQRFDPEKADPLFPPSVRARYAIPSDRPIVAYLGLLTDYQGIPHLLQAASRLKRWGKAVHFLIMGFPDLSRYQLMAQRLGVADCVTLPGKIPYAQAPNWLMVGDIAITAKMSATEGSGKLLNYMALGLPVIAYDSPVHREYLGEHGVYVPSGDIDGLARSVADLLDDSARQVTLSAGLRQRVRERFTWAVAGREIDQLYARLTASDPAADAPAAYTTITQKELDESSSN